MAKQQQPKRVNAIVERAKAHYADQGYKTHEVPEWGDGDEPLIVYFTPMTPAEQQAMVSVRDREGTVIASVDLVIRKALDENGDRIFTLEDKQALKTRVDVEVLAGIAAAMLDAPTVEDQAGN